MCAAPLAAQSPSVGELIQTPSDDTDAIIRRCSELEATIIGAMKASRDSRLSDAERKRVKDAIFNYRRLRRVYRGTALKGTLPPEPVYALLNRSRSDTRRMSAFEMDIDIENLDEPGYIQLYRNDASAAVKILDGMFKGSDALPDRSDALPDRSDA